MMRREKLAIAKIYVQVKRRATLKPDTVREIAESMLESSQSSRNVRFEPARRQSVETGRVGFGAIPRDHLHN